MSLLAMGSDGVSDRRRREKDSHFQKAVWFKEGRQLKCAAVKKRARLRNLLSLEKEVKAATDWTGHASGGWRKRLQPQKNL